MFNSLTLDSLPVSLFTICLLSFSKRLIKCSYYNFHHVLWLSIDLTFLKVQRYILSWIKAQVWISHNWHLWITVVQCFMLQKLDYIRNMDYRTGYVLKFLQKTQKHHSNGCTLNKTLNRPKEYPWIAYEII